MYRIIPFDAEHVLGVRLEGEVSKSEYEQLNARMKRHLQQHASLSIYAEIPSVEHVPVDGTLEDLIMSIEHWKQLKRKAVVTGMQSVRLLEPVVDKLSPGIDVRVFDDAHTDEARTWVVD